MIDQIDDPSTLAKLFLGLLRAMVALADLSDFHRILIFVFSSPTLLDVPEHWCTVTVTDNEGRRHSVDVQASSTFDAAHLYVAHAKGNPGAGLPVPTVATVFEVVTSGRIYRVNGAALQRWIAERRQEWKGPKGFLFSQRPML